jgi:hypothetical protein
MGLYASKQPVFCTLLAKRVFSTTSFFLVTYWKNRESNILELNPVKSFKNAKKNQNTPTVLQFITIMLQL